MIGLGGLGHTPFDLAVRGGPALAQVIKRDKNGETILGQAWLAQENCLVTCGHVVEEFKDTLAGLFVKFPASGNLYAVTELRLHPSFVRQPNQLVKFDVAALNIALSYPESDIKPLSFHFGKSLKTNQPLSAVRYPVHLGQISSALEALAQSGRFLGVLRKHDNFHLLHDLPLAPGDSGAPIFAGSGVVAIHCGDTATIPGLNLPTSSIRLALWVDALRELGLNETKDFELPFKVRPYLSALLIALPAALIAFAVSTWLILQATLKTWQIKQPAVLPVKISFNRPLHKYKPNEDINMTVIPGSACFLYLFQINHQDQVAPLYPPFGLTAYLQRGESRTVKEFGPVKLKADPHPAFLHIVAINAAYPRSYHLAEAILKNSNWAKANQAGRPLLIAGEELIKRIEQVKRGAPAQILHTVMESPTCQ